MLKWYNLSYTALTVQYGGMKVVKSYLKVLVSEKEIKENRRIGIRVIVNECGASRSTVERLLNNSIKNVPLDDLALICEWVPCETSDILRLEEA